MFPLRIAIALWLRFISAMLVGFNRGQLWLLLLIPAIAAHIYIAYQIRPNAAGRRVPRDDPAARLARELTPSSLYRITGRQEYLRPISREPAAANIASSR
jgi:hypothetical protein